MTGTVTQCPNCQTSFRVSQDQLEIADGRVRCGQCDHVFNALDQAAALQQSASSFTQQENEPDPWRGIGEESVEAVQAELEQAQEREPVEANQSDLNADEYSDFENSDHKPDDTKTPGTSIDGELEATQFGHAGPEQPQLDEESLDATQLEHPRPDAEDDSAAVTQFENAGSDKNQIDAESLAEEQLDDDDLLFDDLGPRHEKDVVEEELLRGDVVQESEFDESFFASLEDSELTEHEETRLELPPLHSQEQDHDADQTMLVQPSARARSQDSDTRWAMELIDDLQRDKTEAAHPIAQDFAIDDATQLDSFSVSGSIDQQFDGVGYADDYVSTETEHGSDFDKARRGAWLWTLACLLLVLLLGAQYTLFNFGKLATDSRFRPVLAQACALLPCELPVLEDLGKISFEKLAVRSHPEKKDSLMVNVVITNRASFAQPFPVLELTFSDLRGNTVANESYYPSEYLHGELSGMTLMPSKNPVHLALDVADPGAAAINYNLKLVKGYD